LWPAAEVWCGARGRRGGRPRRAARASAATAPPPRATALPCRPGLQSSFELISEDLGAPRQRRPRSCLHRSERDAEELCDLALREAAPVRERDHLALALVELFERA